MRKVPSVSLSLLICFVELAIRIESRIETTQMLSYPLPAWDYLMAWPTALFRWSAASFPLGTKLL
jgi:hypothetical protein